MRYTKKRITVEAFQMTRERRADISEWPQWLHEAWNKGIGEIGSVAPSHYPDSDGMDKLEIITLEGPMEVDWGDYIIQGIEGELYPCKPDIFERSYTKEMSLLSMIAEWLDGRDVEPRLRYAAVVRRSIRVVAIVILMILLGLMATVCSTTKQLPDRELRADGEINLKIYRKY